MFCFEKLQGSAVQFRKRRWHQHEKNTFSTEGAFKFFYQGYFPLEMSSLCDMPLSAPGLLSHGGGDHVTDNEADHS